MRITHFWQPRGNIAAPREQPITKSVVCVLRRKWKSCSNFTPSECAVCAAEKPKYESSSQSSFARGKLTVQSRSFADRIGASYFAVRIKDTYCVGFKQQLPVRYVLLNIAKRAWFCGSLRFMFSRSVSVTPKGLCSTSTEHWTVTLCSISINWYLNFENWE